MIPASNIGYGVLLPRRSHGNFERPHAGLGQDTAGRADASGRGRSSAASALASCSGAAPARSPEPRTEHVTPPEHLVQQGGLNRGRTYI